ncbi:hypothetical protein Tco_0953317 [Tanacetum coccineum]|uniref:Uncharacterized protein n=1 Tax=Tanacetum coccineum TaxID=301880 RepID=A0ABQ5E085_9ASTR
MFWLSDSRSLLGGVRGREDFWGFGNNKSPRVSINYSACTKVLVIDKCGGLGSFDPPTCLLEYLPNQPLVTPKSSNLSAVKENYFVTVNANLTGYCVSRVSSFDQGNSYSDSDYAVKSRQKIHTGGCHFLVETQFLAMQEADTLWAVFTTGGENMLLLIMAVLDSCPKHNMVAYLEKSEGNGEFHEIIDFLKRSSIHHALTVSPLVSTTFVEQFWTSAIVPKQFNNVRTLLPKVAGKALFDALLLRGKGKHFSGKVTPLFATMLVRPTQDEGASSERPSEALPTPSHAPISEVPHEPQTDSSPAQTSENLGGHSSSDKPLSGNEGDMTLQSVYDLCLSLCAQVSDQAKEIQNLKAQITKLKKQAKPVIKHHRAWLKSVSLKQRFPSKSFSKKHRVHKESVSKQGRKFAKGESSVQRDPLFDEVPEDIKNKGTEEQVESTNGHKKGTEEEIATQATQTPTSTIFGDDETIAKVLLNMSQAKAVSREKEKGVELKDIEETDRPRPTSTRSLLTLKPLPKIDPKDKGKKKIEEEDESESESDGIPEAEKKFKQLASDEEMARKIQEEWEGEEERNRLAEEKATNEALIRNYDDIKARIEADRLLAEKLQEEEREQFTIEERAKFLHDTIAAQRKFLAQQRSEAIRNRPPTKNQLRNQMMTYLKHVGNFKHSELKTKKFEEIQALYEKIKRSDEDFISIGSAEDERLIKKMNEKGIDFSKKEEVKEESKEEVQEESKEEESKRKRKLGTRKKMKSRKRRFIQNTSEDDSEKENDELRLHLTIAPDEEKEVDYEILDRKYPIKEWKTECLGTKPQVDKAEHLEEINQNVVIRSNGQKRYFSTLMRVLSIFDRDDLNVVYQLVMNRYQDEIPEGFDRVLWGDLMVMFNPDDEDKFWNSQQDWNIVSWKLHGSSGVHTLVTEAGLVIHMLVEKKYPLRKKKLVQMLKLKLESEEDSTMALELIRFIKKLLAELEPEDSDGDEEDL